MTRTTRTLATWVLSAVAAGILVGIILVHLLSPLPVCAATAPRSAQDSQPPVSLRADDDRPRSGARPVAALPGRTEAPNRERCVAAASDENGLYPLNGRESPDSAPQSPSVAASPRPTPTRAPGPVPAVGARTTGHTVRGIASFVDPAYGSRYLALPDGPGQRVRICGPAACVTRTSNDAGPDLAMQRAGRVADLSFADFARICGCNPWVVGLVTVTVEEVP